MYRNRPSTGTAPYRYTLPGMCTMYMYTLGILYTSSCHHKIESNKHTVVTCPRYTDARQQFAAKTGIRICEANYIDIMALNYRKLGLDSKVLATALCKLLAQIARTHTKMNKIASVAHSLGSNQRRLIFQTNRFERPPD